MLNLHEIHTNFVIFYFLFMTILSIIKCGHIVQFGKLKQSIKQIIHYGYYIRGDDVIICLGLSNNLISIWYF